MTINYKNIYKGVLIILWQKNVMNIVHIETYCIRLKYVCESMFLTNICVPYYTRPRPPIYPCVFMIYSPLCHFYKQKKTNSELTN